MRVILKVFLALLMSSLLLLTGCSGNGLPDSSASVTGDVVGADEREDDSRDNIIDAGSLWG